jgi:spermidine synthase
MLLLLVGLLAILSQVVLLRELSVAFYGVELVYSLALTAWMVGGAVGALVRLPHSGRRLAWLLATAALLLPAGVVWIRASRLVLGGIPGAYLPFTDQMIVLLVSLLPQAALLGLAFRWAAADAASSGRTLVWSYAVESAGACLGAVAATVGFVAGLQTFTVAVLSAGLCTAALVARGPREAGAGIRGAHARGAASLVVLALTAAGGWSAPGADLAMTAWAHPAVIASRDSPYARVTATRAGSQTALFLDDVLVFESESAVQEELAHVGALAHRLPRQVLVLGGAASGIGRELMKHAPERVVSVEADRVYADLSRRLAGGPDVVIADPRQFLREEFRELQGRGSQEVKFLPKEVAGFDVIVVAMPQPTSGQSNRFYTREFFEECRGRLRPGGLVALRLDLPENSVSPLLALQAASVVRALRATFPSVCLLRGTSVLALASDSPLPTDPGPLIARWHERRLATRLVRPPYLTYLWENDRRAELEALLQRTATAPNTDARPVCYQVAAIGWLARFYPRLLTFGRTPFPAPFLPAGVVVAIFAVVLVARRTARASAGAQAALAGFAGMLLETVLLLAYQSRSGALYERLGVLLLAFMVGLTAGAALVGRALARRDHASGSVARRMAARLGLLLVALGALVAALVSTGTATGLWGTSLLMLASGGLTAGIFACASMAVSPAPVVTPQGVQNEPISDLTPLYAADLAGGAAGSLLAGMVLVPSAGLAPTAGLVAVVGLAGLALRVTASLRARHRPDTPRG